MDGFLTGTVRLPIFALIVHLYRIMGNFRGREPLQISKKWRKLLRNANTYHGWVRHTQILSRKLSRVALKPWNLWTFLPRKFSAIRYSHQQLYGIWSSRRVAILWAAHMLLMQLIHKCYISIAIAEWYYSFQPKVWLFLPQHEGSYA